jgi:hypothetical protein
LQKVAVASYAALEAAAFQAPPNEFFAIRDEWQHSCYVANVY